MPLRRATHPGSAYCGYDCEPTHISRDTDTRAAGQLATPMRWRPDLVTAADDRHLTLVSSGRQTGYTGRYNAGIYEDTNQPDVWHLRLDDGHRYVGRDLPNMGAPDGIISTGQVARIRDTWQRLERELTNPRQQMSNDPWADVMPLDGIVRVASLNAATVILRYSDGSEEEIALHDGGELAVTTETHHDVEDIDLFPRTIRRPGSNRYRIVLNATYYPGSTADGVNLTITSRPATEPSNPQRSDSAPSTY